MKIVEGGLTRPEVIDLLAEHLEGMAEHSPPESIHALDITGLEQPEITFWTVWERGALLAAGRSRTWAAATARSSPCAPHRITLDAGSP